MKELGEIDIRYFQKQDRLSPFQTYKEFGVASDSFCGTINSAITINAISCNNLKEGDS